MPAAADPAVTPALYSRAVPAEVRVAAYRDYSASQARNYDKSQDISPRQLVLLLEVAERTGSSLGQALATGEHESARTWNDHIRPTLQNGSLGSAAGVWQFIPVTFHAIIREYGARLLAASDADPAAGRGPLDLGEGPFTDADVRRLIRETLDGARGPGDEELQLLRHNFAVLAFARHYLSLDSGATNPVEDYLFHFLGAGEGRRVLALAQGEARDTLCVKPAVGPDALEPAAALAAQDLRAKLNQATSLVPALPSLGEPAAGRASAPLDGVSPTLRLRVRGESEGPAVGGRIRAIESETGLGSIRTLDLGLAGVPRLAIPPPLSSQWGLPADSPTVTGNLGMFYRDGKEQTQPYTWGEFLDNLARRVKADAQPALVRAKYGVGFPLNGGDLPDWAFDPQALSKARVFRRPDGQPLPVPEALVTGPLSREEMEHYKQRLGALVSQGEDEPAGVLPPESLGALRHLGLLAEGVQPQGAADPEVIQALQAFRRQVGKDEPDNPAHSGLLMPAERVALEIYDRRLTRFASLQRCQERSFAEAPDLSQIAKLPTGLQRRAAPHVLAVKQALAAQGLLKPPLERHVWRDKKRKKHVDYRPAALSGKADKETIAALDGFQLRHGLRQTQGVLDAVTLEMLGLPPMGPEIFEPLSGPHCGLPPEPEILGWCEVPGVRLWQAVQGLSAPGPRPSARLLEAMSAPDHRGCAQEAS